ncbi:MAG: glycosyltransferase [Gammaproteobacteria bacterium]|nr:glycosyltransferase [Gammaproteobacteria bacterium]
MLKIMRCLVNTYRTVSVLMAVYRNDDPKAFWQALQSITLMQNVKPNEVVLVIDGPINSELEAVVKNFSLNFQSFKVIRNERNIGLALSLRKGVTACTGDLIARMDSDDVAMGNRLEAQLNVIDKGFDVIYSSSKEFEGSIDNVHGLNIAPPSKNLRKVMNYRNPIVHPSVLMKKELVLKVGNYRDLRLFEDYDLFLRLLNYGALFYGIQEPLIYFRVSKELRGRRGGFSYFRKGLAAKRIWMGEKLINKWHGSLSILPFFVFSCGGDFVKKVVYKILRK